MRIFDRVERSFTTKLVGETRKIVTAKKPVYEKIALLYFNGARHFERAEKFRWQLEESIFCPKKTQKLEAIIALRERAGGYLWATAQFLRNHETQSLSLRRMPRLFAIPKWGQSNTKLSPDRPQKSHSDEITFMDFSS